MACGVLQIRLRVNIILPMPCRCFFVVSQGIGHYLPGSSAEKTDALGVGGHESAVAGKGEAYGLGEGIHGVGGEHSRA